MATKLRRDSIRPVGVGLVELLVTDWFHTVQFAGVNLERSKLVAYWPSFQVGF